MAVTTTPLSTSASAPDQLSSEERVSQSFWRDAWRRFKKDRVSLAALLVFASLCVIALSAPLISQWNGYDPNKINLREDYQAPNSKHWFGTDEYGRDYFTRIVWAGRVSISIGFLIALIEVTIGVVLGLISGYFGGVIDDFLQATVNIISSIPFLPLLIILGSLFPLDPLTLALLVSVLGWTGELRLVRGQVLSVKQRDYVLSARAIGSKDRRVMFQH